MKLARLSPKAYRSLMESTAFCNLWVGAVRSGKTVVSLIRWLEFIYRFGDYTYAIIGKTERTIKHNILDVIADLVGPSRVKLNLGAGECKILGRTCILVGANDLRAEQKIRGVTLGGAYGDEVSLWPESMWRMLWSRLSVPRSKLFATTNPDSAYHWLYTNFIQRAHELNMRVFDFTLDDNLALNDEIKQQIKSGFSGLWYRRFILGEWVAGDGIIYDSFDPSKHVVDAAPRCHEYILGIDYGTINPTVAIVVGLDYNTRSYYAIDELYYDPERERRSLTDAEQADRIIGFAADYPVRDIYMDPAAASLRLELARRGLTVNPYTDNDVLEGIKSVARLIAEGRLYIADKCSNLIKEISNYSWDVSASQRLGRDIPRKQNDHACDALRYALHTHTSLGAADYEIVTAGAREGIYAS